MPSHPFEPPQAGGSEKRRSCAEGRSTPRLDLDRFGKLQAYVPHPLNERMPGFNKNRVGPSHAITIRHSNDTGPLGQILSNTGLPIVIFGPNGDGDGDGDGCDAETRLADRPRGVQQTAALRGIEAPDNSFTTDTASVRAAPCQPRPRPATVNPRQFTKGAERDDYWIHGNDHSHHRRLRRRPHRLVGATVATDSDGGDGYEAHPASILFSCREAHLAGPVIRTATLSAVTNGTFRLSRAHRTHRSL